MRHDYPIHVDIAGQACLVVGGGRVAVRKIAGLRQAGAKVTVISPAATAELSALAANDAEVVLCSRPYASGDVERGSADGSRWRLVVAATDAAKVNLQVHGEAERCGIFVNVVDRPELSSFIVPSIVRRGKLTFTVSTGGASPSAGRRIAAEVNAAYGAEYELYLDFLSEVRELVQRLVADKELRHRMFKRMLDWDVPALIRSGEFPAWRSELLGALDREPDLRTVEAFARRE